MKTPRYTLKQLSAPARDDNFCDIVISALRYALPRHSCMPSLTRGYILRHWKLLAPKHWCILRDIREHFHDATQWKLRHPENHLAMDEYDLQEWVKFYNRLLIHPDTNITPEERRHHPSLPSSDTSLKNPTNS